MATFELEERAWWSDPTPRASTEGRPTPAPSPLGTVTTEREDAGSTGADPGWDDDGGESGGRTTAPTPAGTMTTAAAVGGRREVSSDDGDGRERESQRASLIIFVER